MKDSVILLASILGCLSLKAQNTLYKSENAPRPGDKIIKERISYFDPGEKGDKKKNKKYIFIEKLSCGVGGVGV